MRRNTHTTVSGMSGQDETPGSVPGQAGEFSPLACSV